MKKVIGFANKMYTLWEVSDVRKSYTSKYNYVMKQDYTYIHNLSLNLEEAKKKVDGYFEIDLDLRGSSSFIKFGESFDETPDSVFKFGKYIGEDIVEVNDISYTEWYYSETKNPVAKKLLLDNDYIEYEDSVVTEEQYESILENLEKEKYMDSLEKGHLFENGKRVELEIKEVNSFHFDGFYGTTYVVTYSSKCGKLLKYMGGNPPEVSVNDFTNVKATVKHDNYNDVDETKLQRIKVLSVA